MIVRINTLGPIEVIVGGRVIQLTGQRQRALLAALALERGRAVPVERLVDVLWDVNPPATARAKIQAHVSALRQAIGQDMRTADGPLATRPPGYALQLKGVELDLAEFEALTAQASAAAAAGQPAAASRLYAQMLALWRGSAFADVESPLIRSAAAKLEERRLLGAEAKADADLALGQHDRVVSEVAPWLAMHPFRERMRAMLMLALYRLGCRADALALYRDGYQQMVAELGLEPGPQLRALHQHLLADEPALLAAVREPAASGAASKLPPSADHADGREPGPFPWPAQPLPWPAQPPPATYVSTLTVGRPTRSAR
jgi:DNA-binding SARP family transcriptional activator